MRRKGETGPPEVRVHLIRGFSRKRLLRNEANKYCVFSGWLKWDVKNSVFAAPIEEATDQVIGYTKCPP
jgi:hypothetical protein